jgi:hypothetical protein
MTRSSRYQIKDVYLEQGDVTTYHGRDPLTGLPVLIYRFPGVPQSSTEHFESGNIPGVLETSFDGKAGQVVVAFSDDYKPFVAHQEIDPLEVVLAAAGTLRDASRAGVLHGDINPRRFLRAKQHLLIEGYGIPWKPIDETFLAPEHRGIASYAADVYSLAKSLLTLLNQHLPEAIQELLTSCLAKDPTQRPTSEELHDALSVLHVGEHNAPQQLQPGPLSAAGLLDLVLDDHPTAPTDIPTSKSLVDTSLSQTTKSDFNVEIDLDSKRVTPQPTLSSSTSVNIHRPSVKTDDRANSEAEALTLNTDPGVAQQKDRRPVDTSQRAEPQTRKMRKPKEDEEGFVKNLPPGATYRAGEVDESVQAAVVLPKKSKVNEGQPRRTRRVLVLASLLLVVTGLASLSLLLVPRLDTPPQTEQSVAYVIDVQVEPANLPPINVYVVESPSDSEFRSGTVLGSAPRKIVFDVPGTWLIQGEFQNRRSEIVTLNVPEEREAIIVIPEASTPSR